MVLSPIRFSLLKELLTEEKDFVCLHRPRSKALRSVRPSHLQNASSLTFVLLKAPSSVREQRGLLEERSRRSTQYGHGDWSADTELRQRQQEREASPALLEAPTDCCRKQISGLGEMGFFCHKAFSSSTKEKVSAFVS